MTKSDKYADLADCKLIDIFLAGEEPAFSELVKKYLKPVYNFIFRLVYDRDSAEDLTQETFLKAWKNMKRFDPDKSFKTWLFTIAKNTAFDYLKKKKEIPFSNFTDEEGENWLENIADENFLPDELLELKNISEELDAILEKLPWHYRAILILHYKEDFSLHEIAEILDEPYNTIKSRRQRGLAILKKLFSGESN
jgi:RNA polymerase sigma-70 factor, ECF subfamily